MKTNFLGLEPRNSTNWRWRGFAENSLETVSPWVYLIESWVRRLKVFHGQTLEAIIVLSPLWRTTFQMIRKGDRKTAIKTAANGQMIMETIDESLSPATRSTPGKRRRKEILAERIIP